MEFVVVIDFEATCNTYERIGKHVNQIIEFAAVLVSLENRQIVSRSGAIFYCGTYILQIIRRHVLLYAVIALTVRCVFFADGDVPELLSAKRCTAYLESILPRADQNHAGPGRCRSTVPGGLPFVRGMAGKPRTVDSWRKLDDVIRLVSRFSIISVHVRARFSGHILISGYQEAN